MKKNPIIPLFILIITAFQACNDPSKKPNRNSSSPSAIASIPDTKNNPFMDSVQKGGLWVGLGISGTLIGLIIGTIMGSKALEDSKKCKEGVNNGTKKKIE